MSAHDGTNLEPSIDRPILIGKSAHITIGFVIQIGVVLLGIMAAFSALRADTMAALKEIAKQEAIIQQQGQVIIDMRMAILEIKTDQNYFHKQYEEDMNRYVRDRPRK